jgi:hypothetical protein
MKKLLSISAALLIAILSQAQLTVTYPNQTEVLNGTSIEVATQASIFDQEVVLWVTNDSETTYNVKCRRTELDVLPGTENNVCWLICPNTAQIAGENPVWVVGFGTTELQETADPGETVQSFAFHYHPENLIGCSNFRVEFFNADEPTQTLAQFDILFNHSDNCVVGLDESQNLNFSMVPNPADQQVAITLERQKGVYRVEVSDVLGQVIYKEQVNAALNNKLILPTATFKNGMYFLSITDGKKTLKTSKLLVKH